MHHSHDLMVIFNHCFTQQYNTCLVNSDSEPLYQPSDHLNAQHRILFAHGFFSSALHECAHWLIAGVARRQQVDYGYWYQAQDRTAAQQAQFESVEVKPQALEWLLSNACGYRFEFSFDNLSISNLNCDAFKQAVYQQVVYYYQHGLPKRAQRFHQALLYFYGTGQLLEIPT